MSDGGGVKNMLAADFGKRLCSALLPPERRRRQKLSGMEQEELSHLSLCPSRLFSSVSHFSLENYACACLYESVGGRWKKIIVFCVCAQGGKILSSIYMPCSCSEKDASSCLCLPYVYL